ncbi:ornithine cyclodeaminase family protein [Balneatrix alpica]|uniref:ornithine cyclodeaminase family protein n=1 Tax=Balneatrix alpica TaxID=75684 RepID=UPI00273A0BC4|nr:ornithine cyclodeaminase family protein [Balneatrix alpica]
MLWVSAEQVITATPWAPLIEALQQIFRDGCSMPQRLHYDVKVPGGSDATLLLMPAWQEGAFIGVKVVSVFPDNAERGEPAINGHYLLSCGQTGQLRALIDGGELTARRTAAASALAARYLARADAEELLMVGTGRLSINLIEAHSAVRPLKRIRLWGRSLAKSQQMAAELRDQGLAVEAVADLASACASADIISCATLSATPLVQGQWLKPGAHLDLVGAYKPNMRETDDESIRRAQVFVDTRAGASKEGGDIVIPLATGVLTPESIQADLYELCRGQHPGRQHPDEITLFKSVGASLEDLAAAVLVYRQLTEGNQP